MKRTRPSTQLQGYALLLLPFGDYSSSQVKIQKSALSARAAHIVSPEDKGEIASVAAGNRVIVVTSDTSDPLIRAAGCCSEVAVKDVDAAREILTAQKITVVTPQWVQINLANSASAPIQNDKETILFDPTANLDTEDVDSEASIHFEAAGFKQIKRKRTESPVNDTISAIKADEIGTIDTNILNNSVKAVPIAVAMPSVEVVAAKPRQATLFGFLQTGKITAPETGKATEADVKSVTLSDKKPSIGKFHVFRVPPSAIEAVEIPNDVWLRIAPTGANAPFDTKFKHDIPHGALGDRAASALVAAAAERYANLQPKHFGVCDIFVSSGSKPSEKILALDVDGTLIAPTSGKFSSAADDWHFAFPGIAKKIAVGLWGLWLQAFHAAGYRIVLVSNQLGISKGHTTLPIVHNRFQNIQKKLGIPVTLMFASADDFFRKPRPGMWYLLQAKCNGGVRIDLDSSIYVGDAAGRPKTATSPRDHSASDLQFALNAGVRFQTPEAFFSGSRSPRDLDPLTVANLGFQPLVSLPPPAARTEDTLVFLDGKPEWMVKNEVAPMIVLLCAPPGCGKSTLCAQSLPWLQRVNQDTLKTKAKCMAAAEEALSRGQPVVIDATNVDMPTRADWIAFAKKRGVPIHAMALDTPKEVAVHFNTVRNSNPLGGADGPDDTRAVPPMVLFSMFKKLQVPVLTEGFTSVCKLQLVPGPFEEDRSAATYEFDEFRRSVLYTFA